MDALPGESRIFKFMFLCGLIVVFMAVSMVLMGSNTQGADIYVDDDNVAGPWIGSMTNPYQNITSAIANSNPTDDIFVWDGSYNENITIDKSLQLIGNGSATTQIDGFGTMNNIINITAEGVEVTGFNITESGSWYGIWASVGGFNIHDNLFNTQNYAIYIDIKRNLMGSTVMGDMVIDNNEVNGTDGFFLDIEFKGPVTGSDLIFGQTVITNNTLYDTNTGIKIEDYAVFDAFGGSIVIGDVAINDNLINSNGENGIYFWGWVINMTDVNVDLGNLNFSGNDITSDVICMNIVSWNTIDLFGSTVVTIHNTTLYNNNILSPTYNGIVLYTSYYFYIYDLASVTTGDFYITSNNVTASGLNGQGGICIYMFGIGQFMLNDSSVGFGNMYIDSNLITAVEEGILIEIQDSGADMYDNSITNIGDIYVTNNEINSTKNGVHLKISDIGVGNHGSSRATFGNLKIAGNDILSKENGTYVNLVNAGNNMNDQDSLIIGDFEIGPNNINSTKDGIHLNIQDIGNNMAVDSIVQLGAFNVISNTITATCGINITRIENLGVNMSENSTFSWSGLHVSNNMIDATRYGIYNERGTSPDFNYIGFWGIWLNGSSTFAIGSVDFDDNIINATEYGIKLDHISHLGNYLNDGSTFSMGGISFNKNHITTLNSHGMFFEWFNDWGTNMDGNSRFIIGNVTFNENNITSGGNGIAHHSMERHGYNMYNNSIYMGENLEFNWNLISASGNGLYFDDFQEWGKQMYGNATFLMGDVTFDDNVINSAGLRGISHQELLQHLGYMMNDGSLVQIGNISFSRNTITAVTDGIFFDKMDYWGFGMNGSCTFIMENLFVNDNVISAGADGIYHVTLRYHGYDMMVNSSYQMQNVEFLRNEIIAGTNGLRFWGYHYWGYLLSGSSRFQMGDILIKNNKINASGNGILQTVIFGHWGTLLNNTSSVIMGDISFSENIIEAGDNGMDLNIWQNWGYDMEISTSVIMGNVLFNDNIINATNFGIYLSRFSELGGYISGDSTVRIGDISFDNNHITTLNSHGMFLDRFNDWGTNMYDNSAFYLGNLTVNNNIIEAGGNGIAQYSMERFGFNMYDDSICIIGDIKFNWNQINASSNGMYFDDFQEWGKQMYGNAVFLMGDVTFDDNVINSNGSGGISHQELLQHLGYMMNDGSLVQIGNISFSRNTITAVTDGIYYDDLDFWGYDMNGSSRFIFGDLTVNDNVIVAQEEGIFHVTFRYHGYDMKVNSSCQMGSVMILRNNITSGTHGLVLQQYGYWGYQLFGTSTFTMGDILIDNNEVNATGCGIFQEEAVWNFFGFWGWSLNDASSYTMGDISFSFNRIIAGENATLFYDWNEWGVFVNDTSSATIGNVHLNDNSINATKDGIVIEDHSYIGYEMRNDSILDIGTFEMRNNIINASGNVTRIVRMMYFAANIYDNAYASFGDFLLNNNTIYAGIYGIYVDRIVNLGYMTYGSSIADFANFEFNDNTIDSTNRSIYLDQVLYDSGKYMYENSQVHFGYLQVNNNNIKSRSVGIYYEYFADCGSRMYDQSYFERGTFEIRNNTIDTTGITKDGIYVNNIYDLGYFLHNDSIAVFGDFLFNDNTITSRGNGININNFWYIGRYLFSNSSASFGNIEFNNNDIGTSGGEGIHLRCQRFITQLQGTSLVVFGEIQIKTNTILSSKTAIDFSAIYYGQETFDDSTAYAGMIHMESNELQTDEKGIVIYFFNAYYEIYNNSHLTFEDMMIYNNVISAFIIGIDIQYESCGDLHNTSTAYIPGIHVMGNTVEAITSTFNYFTSSTPTYNDPGATQVWGDVTLENNEFIQGINGAAIEWSNSNPLVPQPIFHIINTNIHDGFGISTGLLLINITDVYTEELTIDKFDKGIISHNSTVHHMLNGSISNSDLLDISLYTSSYLLMINSTFDNSSVYFDDLDSQLKVAWFMNVLVQSQAPLPVADATVVVANIDGTGIFNSTTDADGKAFLIICMEYEENISGIVKNYNYYTANATKFGIFGFAAPNPIMNRTQLVVITLIDTIPPNLFGDNSDSAGTTGDPFYFEINATDNMAIVSVHVNYRFNGTALYTNLTLNGTGPYWVNEIIPTAQTGFIEYYFTAVDTGGLWVNTTPTTAPISDNDAPTFVWISKPMVGNTGESVLVSIQAADNIGITYFKIDVDGVLYDLVKDGDYYNLTIDIPLDSISDIIYSIVLNDSAGNNLTILGTTITVLDVYTPIYTWVLRPTTGIDGGSVIISLLATDNVGITKYTITINGTTYGMIKDGDYYNYTFNIPPGSVGNLTYNVTFTDDFGNLNVTENTLLNITELVDKAPTYTWVQHPTAGTPDDNLLVSLMATDDFGIVYYKIEIDGVLYDMANEGDYYNITINIPGASLADITYRVIFNDTAGNEISTEETTIIVSDEDVPTDLVDNSDTAATTGDPFSFYFDASDNIGLAEAEIFYWFGTGFVSSEVVLGTGPYTHTITIPSGSVDELHYFVQIKDTSGNSMTSATADVPVTDNDKPSDILDSSNTTATTGDDFTFTVDGSDNIGIVEVEIYYWFGNGEETLITVSGVGPFSQTISLPAEATETLHYYFVILDAADNELIGPQVDVGVADNDPATISNDQSDTSGEEGKEFTFKIDAADNIGVYRVRVAYWFAVDDLHKQFIILTEEAGTYSGSFIPSESGSLNYYFEVSDTAGNILEGPQQSALVVSAPKEEEDETSLLPWILVIFMILVVLIFFFLIMKKKKDEDEIPEVEEGLKPKEEGSVTEGLEEEDKEIGSEEEPEVEGEETEFDSEGEPNTGEGEDIEGLSEEGEDGESEGSHERVEDEESDEVPQPEIESEEHIAEDVDSDGLPADEELEDEIENTLDEVSDKDEN